MNRHTLAAPLTARSMHSAGSVVPGFRRLALCTSLLSVLAFGVADAKPLLILLGLIVATCSWLMTRVAANEPVRALPRLALNLLVGAATIYLVLALLGSRQDSVISALTDYLCLVLLIKMLDRASMRDESQMLTLSVFVVIGAVLSGAQLALGLVLVVYTPLIIASVITWQVCAGEERAAQRSAAAGGLQLTDAPTARPSRMGRQLAGVIALAVLLSLGAGVLAFIVTPRSFAQGLGGQWGRPLPGAVAGFTDQIRLGQSGLLSQSGTPVADVTLLGASGESIGASDEPVYLRGAVLDRYDPKTGQWTSSTPASAIHKVEVISRKEGERRFALADQSASPAMSRTVVTQRIAMRAVPATEAPLFGALYPVAVTLPTERDRNDREPSVSVNDATGAIVRSGGRAGPLTYTIESRPDFVMSQAAIDRLDVLHLQDRPRDRDPKAETLPKDPFRTGPVRDLAVQLLKTADVPLDPAQREPFQNRRAASTFVGHLRQFEYTLEMVAPAEGQDPIEMFLFQTKRGHCEYFASAMVAMCQSVGIDARVVTGYVSGEYNSIAGHYIVRESDAHAWVELATRPGRWETFDPTPPASLQHALRASTGILAWFQHLYDALEFSWVQNVISFDSAKRSQIVGYEPSLGDPTALFAIRRAITDFGSWMRRILPSGALGDIVTVATMVLVFAGLCGLGFIVVAAILRRLRPRAAPPAPNYTHPPPELAALLAFYPRMLGSLAAHGRAKPEGTPPRHFARGLEPLDPTLAGLVRTVADRYYAARFGRQPIAPGDPEVEAALSALRGHLASRPAVR